MKVDTGGDFWQENANKKCHWHARKGDIIQLAVVQNVQAGQQLWAKTTRKSSKQDSRSGKTRYSLVFFRRDLEANPS